MNLMRQLWQDEAGVIVSTEIILIMMILVFGLIAGMVSLRDSVAQELGDSGLMVNDLNQGFSFSGTSNNVRGTAVTAPDSANTPGSVFDDLVDANDVNDSTGAVPGGLSLVGIAGAAESP